MHPALRIDKPELVRVSLRLLITWTVLSVLILVSGRRVVDFFLPFIAWVIKQIQSDYWPQLAIDDRQPDLIQMIGEARHAIPALVAAGDQLTAGVHVLHALVPVVIFYSLLMAFPVKSMRHRALLLLLSLPFNWLLIATSVPFQLAGHIELLFQELAQQYQVEREPGWLLDWMLFLEVGGRWLIPIVFALVHYYICRNLLEREVKSCF